MSQGCDVMAALANRPSAAPLLLPAFWNVGALRKTRSHETRHRSYCTWTWLHRDVFVAGGTTGLQFRQTVHAAAGRLLACLMMFFFTVQEGSQLCPLVFVKEHPWHCCLLLFRFRQARFNKNPAPETRGERQSPRKWGCNQLIPFWPFDQIQLKAMSLSICKGVICAGNKVDISPLKSHLFSPDFYHLVLWFILVELKPVWILFSYRSAIIVQIRKSERFKNVTLIWGSLLHINSNKLDKQQWVIFFPWFFFPF